eukprot:jgi/Chlat1/3116/Chrsp21S03349
MQRGRHPGVIAVNRDEGRYTVNGNLWTVPKRYVLHEVLGKGSYGEVVRASDSELNRQVALKRIPRVLCHPEMTKRILREVCILRRLSHPNIIAMTDAFLQPATHDSDIDMYIATELAAGGDLFAFKGTLTAQRVREIMHQLLLGLRYLHSCRVWHRDVKSQNVLVTSDNQVKICDFGLARSAFPSADLVSSELPQTEARPNQRLTRQYTRAVVTPCYRAPEVIMSNGYYTDKIDVWSAGCIFGELMQRLRPKGAPSRYAPGATPLFEIRYQPGYSGSTMENKQDLRPLLEQIASIVSVIGTPSWHEIDGIQREMWRNYLKCLPGQVGCLMEKVSTGGAQAMDLLMRMLAFDPQRRCSAEEALSHAYFQGMSPSMSQEKEGPLASNALDFAAAHNPAAALAALEGELDAMSSLSDEERKDRLKQLLESEVRAEQLRHQQQRPARPIVVKSFVQHTTRHEKSTLVRVASGRPPRGPKRQNSRANVAPTSKQQRLQAAANEDNSASARLSQVRDRESNETTAEQDACVKQTTTVRETIRLVVSAASSDYFSTEDLPEEMKQLIETTTKILRRSSRIAYMQENPTDTALREAFPAWC